MSLLLPVLLLGLAQPADQAVNASPDQPQMQATSGSTFRAAPKFNLPTGELVDRNSGAASDRQTFDQIEVPPSAKAGPPVCLTMRSYYFERRDDLAPEFVGMTTCDSGRKLTQRRVKRQKARLVPAR